MPKTTRAHKKRRLTKGQTPVTKNQLGRIVRNYVTAVQEHKWWVANVYGQGQSTPFPGNGGEIITTQFTWRTMLCEYNNGTTPWTTMSVGAITAHIDQGTDYYQRIGNKIKLHGFEVLVKFTPLVVSANGNGNICRLMIVHDKQANGAIPASTSIMQRDSYSGMVNNNFRDRFTVMYDKVHTFVPTSTNAGNVASVGPITQMKFWIPVKSIIEYSATSGDIANILKNNFLMGVSSDGANCCAISAAVKTVFVDN